MITELNKVKGVYKHNATGFTVHDVYSIADLIKCNGALAFDEVSGKWAWVAGRDLITELHRYGAVSLLGLATNLLRSYGMFAAGTTFGSMSSTGSARGVTIPRMRFKSASSTKPRIFGIVTNAAAGRGCSASSVVDDSASNNVLKFVGCEVNKTVWTGDTAYLSPFGNGTFSFPGTDARFIGRALIHIPGTTWKAFMDAWADAMPNKDKGEVIDRINAARAIFTQETLVAAYGQIPTILAPVALYSDGTAAIEEPTGGYSVCTNGAVNTHVMYSPFSTVALAESGAGWWITNPIGVYYDGTFAAPVKFRPFGDSNVYACNVLTDAAGNANGPMAPLVTKFTSIDKIDLFRILGGLYPRKDGVAVDVTTDSLRIRAASTMARDNAVSPQGANETPEAYQTRMTTEYGAMTGNYIDALPTTWAFAGQPACVVSQIMLAYLNEGSTKLAPVEAGLNFSGYFSKLLRRAVPNGASNAHVTVPASEGRLTPFDITQVVSYAQA